MSSLTDLAHITLIDGIGYLAAALVFASFYMKTMLPLRVVAITSNVVFMVYAVLDGAAPILVLHALLLPLNAIRLYQVLRLRERVRRASVATFSMEEILAQMSPQEFKAGQPIFQKDDRADKLYYIQTGAVRLPELDRVLGPDAIVGEIGIFTPDGKRTASAICEQDSTLLVLSCEMALQHYFKNPEFGMHLIRMVAERLLDGRAGQKTP